MSIGGNAWIHNLAIISPHRPRARVRRWPAPRLLATLGASLVTLAAMVTAPSPAWLLFLLVQALLLYFLVRYGRERGHPEDLLLDAAWEHLAPETAERDGAARFLTRLCLASPGRGDPELRIKTLAAISRRAAGRSDESDLELQLLAAASVLQVEDESCYGRDAAEGIADLAAMAFRGERSADFAEFVVGAYLARDRELGEIARLRILLIARAFDAGIVPRDLARLWEVAPMLTRILAIEPRHRLGLLCGLWRDAALAAMARDRRGTNRVRTCRARAADGCSRPLTVSGLAPATPAISLGPESNRPGVDLCPRRCDW